MSGIPGKKEVLVLVAAFMPKASKYIADRARNKFGIYQSGWKPLSPDTLRRKSRRKMLSGDALRFKHMKRKQKFGGIGDTPLVDTGRMAGTLRFRNTMTKAFVSIGWPMIIHEQDPDMMDMEHLEDRRHIPPARPLLGPALEESIAPLTADLETFIAVGLSR
jgi:hypothetical protein